MTFSPARRLSVLPRRFAICRLDADAPLPTFPSGWMSVTRTEQELSIVCPEENAPAGGRSARGWRGLAVEGPLPFSEIGVLAALAVPLAAAGVSIFAISTFDTDYVFVPGEKLDDAVAALRAAGHHVT